MKFAFIHAEKALFPLAALCRIFGVTRAGYYAFARRKPSRRQVSDETLRRRVQALFDESHGRYGSPRIQAMLRREQICAGKSRIERVMRELGLRARQPSRFVITTRSDARNAVESNHLDRDFTATKPAQKWVTDITYVWTKSGWAYLAVVLDLFSRAVVGWSLDVTMSRDLVLRALRNAVQRSGGVGPELHHSDRGCQYTSSEYRDELAALGTRVSMSRKGNCWDNAVAESFFSSLKSELLHRHLFDDCASLRSAVFEYIEVFYNRRRLHSSLNYKTPAEVERAFALANAA